MQNNRVVCFVLCLVLCCKYDVVVKSILCAVCLFVFGVVCVCVCLCLCVV